MKDIIKLLTSKIGEKLLSLLPSIVSLLSKFLDFKSNKQKLEEKKTNQKQKQIVDKKIEDVCNKGTISDLLNLSLLLVFLISGCISTEVIVEPTKTWEGHYYSSAEIQKALENIKLEKKESVWILSNSTLERVLKNVKDKNER